MLEWTGERYLPFVDPSICGAEIHYEHLHRYAFASHFVKGKNVLDLASGEGYGTYILSEKANYVVGVDIDTDTVEHAKNTYKKENIEFKTGSILDIPVEGEKIYDVIVCFEAMEHVKEHEALFSEIKRLLKDDGLLIVSTPNKQTYTDDSGYCNPFHQKELNYDEFCDFLKKYFLNTCIFGQRILSGSSIYPTSIKESNICSEFIIDQVNDHFSFTRETEKKAAYFIAIASNTEINKKKIQKSYLIDRSNTEINQNIAKISNLDLQLQNLTNHVSNLDQIIANKDYAIENKDLQLQNLTNHVSNLDQIIVNKDYAIENKDLQIGLLDRQLNDTVANVHSLEQYVSERDQQILKINSHLQFLREENELIKSSISFKLVEKFHHRVIERLLPHNTRRRNHYELGIKGTRILVNDGWQNFYLQFKEKTFRKKIVRKKVYFPHEKIIPVPKPDIPKIIETCVSVIIPTKNAGSDFSGVLEKVTCQKGIKEIEIIIIDSGSSDTTLDDAKKFGSRIYTINPEDFNHGATRNFGAEKARGNYICFLVQDAIPIGDFWLYSMVKALESDPKIAAATCKQIPRSDADLFSCFGLWQHYFYTLDAGSDRICRTDADFDALPGEEKRRLAGLDDVSCLIKKDIFEKFRFRKIQSSEDLDLGKRLIQAGYKNAFFFSIGVIHSHNRDPGYFLRRSYVDTKTVADIIGYQTQEISKDCTLSEILGSVITLYNSLNLIIDSIENASLTLPPRELSAKIRFELLNYFRSGQKKMPEFENKGLCLDSSILAITKHLSNRPDNSNMAQNKLIFDQYEWVLNNFFEYLDIYDSLEDKKEQLRESYYKIFAVIAGASVASYYLREVSTGVLNSEMVAINAELSEGV
jgi:glycosyltransferase involved in cell wall biosynthesis/ubiquinone/menaquinone biosynthesis C-methylase UbiE